MLAKFVRIAGCSCLLLQLGQVAAQSLTVPQNAVASAVRSQRLEDQPAAKRELLMTRVLLVGLRQNLKRVDELGLPQEDAAILADAASSDDEFNARLHADYLRTMTNLCARLYITDSVAMATNIRDIDSSEDEKRRERYSSILGRLSSQGRSILDEVMRNMKMSGTSNEVDLVALAIADPQIVRAGVTRQCASIKQELLQKQSD